ncbi:hypothetical protein LSAT2_014398 [Lamellibrachia satsuma]|nr:hypothetical protein LSAT2_014398 [Lamellibrachia satsuma]
MIAGDRGSTVPPPTTAPPSLHAAHSLGSPLASSPPAPQTLYHAPPSQATYAQRSPFPSPPAPWTLYHARPSPSNVHQTSPDDATSWQTRMFYILEKQNSEMAEMKRMLSSLMKKVATSREEPSSLPERIQFPLASEEAVQALEQDLADKETEKALPPDHVGGSKRLISTGF